METANTNTKKPKISTLDDLFGITDKPAVPMLDGLTPVEYVVELPLEQIDSFENHPYQVRKDRITMGILEDIKHTGRLEQAGVVRPKGNGRYELIAGHRRRLACTLAGRPTLPVVIREMSDDEAIIAMQRSNTQREDVLPSEKAFAYKMRMEAEARQGQRTDLTSSPLETKLRTDEKIAKETGESRAQIQRYISLTKLISPLLDMVDKKFMKSREMVFEDEVAAPDKTFDKGLGMRPAVELSVLPMDLQNELFDLMQAYDSTPSLAQAQRLKESCK